MERVSDSRLWPKSFTGKLLEVLSSKGARLEEPLDDEQEKNWAGRNRTDRSRGHTHDDQQQDQFWTNASMIAKYHFIKYPKEMFPCTKKRNVFNGTSG